MTRYALLNDKGDKVLEVTPDFPLKVEGGPEGGFKFSECYPASMPFTECGPDVREGWSHADGVFRAPDPVEVPPIIRVVSGRKLSYAVVDLEADEAWTNAITKAKPKDAAYWRSVRGGIVFENNPKLARIAAAAQVDLKTLFDRALSP